MLPEFRTYQQTRFFQSLDGLRALSILGVVWAHVWGTSDYHDVLLRTPVLRMGGFGVEVFFAISGFLITTLLLRERQKRTNIAARFLYSPVAAHLAALLHDAGDLCAPGFPAAIPESALRHLFSLPSRLFDVYLHMVFKLGGFGSDIPFLVVALGGGTVLPAIVGGTPISEGIRDDRDAACVDRYPAWLRGWVSRLRDFQGFTALENVRRHCGAHLPGGDPRSCSAEREMVWMEQKGSRRALVGPADAAGADCESCAASERLVLAALAGCGAAGGFVRDSRRQWIGVVSEVEAAGAYRSGQLWNVYAEYADARLPDADHESNRTSSSDFQISDCRRRGCSGGDSQLPVPGIAIFEVEAEFFEAT